MMTNLFSALSLNMHPKAKQFFLFGFFLPALFFMAQTYYRFVEHSSLIPQSNQMLTRSKSLNAALKPNVWPPAYPLALWSVRQVGVPLRALNLGLAGATLFLLFLISKKALANVSPIWLPLTYIVCAANYYNLAQYTSEALVIPLGLLLLIHLAIYQTRFSFFSLSVVAACAAILFTARYHALLWLTPIIAIIFVFLIYKHKKEMTFSFWLWRWVMFAVVAFTPVALVLAQNYIKTGFLTAMNRLDWDARQIKQAENAYYSSSTGLTDNIFLTFKTYFVDFFSPTQYATHKVNYLMYTPSSAEIFGALLFISACVVFALTVIRFLKRGNLANDESPPFWSEFSPLALLASVFWIGYILLTILMWTVGNNDPIYTRFLYPSYPLFLIVMLSAYAFIKKHQDSFWFRLPFIMLFIYFVVVNLYKIFFVV